MLALTTEGPSLLQEELALEQHLQLVPSGRPVITNDVGAIEKSVPMAVSVFLAIPPDNLHQFADINLSSKLLTRWLRMQSA